MSKGSSSSRSVSRMHLSISDMSIGAIANLVLNDEHDDDDDD